MNSDISFDENEEPPSTRLFSLDLFKTDLQPVSSHGKPAPAKSRRRHPRPHFPPSAIDDIFIPNSLRTGGLPSTHVISPQTRRFRLHFYPDISDEKWNDWYWQYRNRIRDLAGLDRIINLSSDERSAILQHTGPLPVSITPYYASLLEADNPLQPLRRTVVMVTDEFRISPDESIDPLAEDEDSPVPGLVHRYPDRVLFLVTGSCSVYCRYCTRSRLVGNRDGHERHNFNCWNDALRYITDHPEVRDVLLSGGDPLTLSAEKLERLLFRLRRIPHIEILRIGTKVPVVLPQRITDSLVRMLKKYHPLWMSIHFTHPDEITPEVIEACGRLADAGIPLGSQTVLLKGVNDDVETMVRLFQGLLKIRVRPYYLYQCDPVRGTAHFRTSVDKGLEIIAGLRGHTTGYAVPTFVVDAPGGGGKIPLLPNSVVGRQGHDLLLRNYEGDIYHYPDPGGNVGRFCHRDPGAI
jgi:lysine 2,3-aminomutase